MVRKIIKIGFLLFLGFILCGANLALAQSQNIKINPFIPQLPPKKEVPPPIEEPKQESMNNEESRNQKNYESIASQPKAVVVEPPALKISGLIWNSSRPQAIINGRVVDVGEMFALENQIEQIKVVAIAKEGIEIEFMGKNFNVSP